MIIINCIEYFLSKLFIFIITLLKYYFTSIFNIKYKYISKYTGKFENKLFIYLIYTFNKKLYNRIKLWCCNKKIDSFCICELWNKIYNSSICKYDDKYNLNNIDGMITSILLINHYGYNSYVYDKFMIIYKGCNYDINWLNILNYKLYSNKKIITNINTTLDENDDDNCINIDNNCKIAIISDWASGTIHSINVLKEIQKFNPNIIIHLGDVYYVGNKDEQKNNLLKPIKKYLPNTKLFILPGNHDYMSGNVGIKYALNKLNQKSTCFSLYNEYIQIQGLDTAFNDKNYLVPIFGNYSMPYIENEELLWHYKRIECAKNKNRKIIFLSHHPLFSNNDKNDLENYLNTKLVKQFNNYINDIDVWFWGHIHWFDIYKPHLVDDDVILKKGRCIGNGAANRDTMPFNEYLEYNKSDDLFKSLCEISNNNLIPKFPKQLYNTCYGNSFVIINSKNNNMNISYYSLNYKNIDEYYLKKVHVENL